MIKATIIPQLEYPSLGSSYRPRTKAGRYLGSMYWDIPSFGSKVWMVAIKVKVENYEEKLNTMSEEEISKECLSLINPIRKIKKVPIHGQLEFYKLQKLKEKDCINLILITDTRKHKSFWGEGTYISKRKKGIKR